MNNSFILVTNDDGKDAVGLHKLIEIAKNFGHVVVVCPEQSRSGQSHAVTITQPLRLKKYSKDDKMWFFTTNGTPVDAVKLALHYVLPEKPILLLSGINHGANSSINVFYSGTMAAVIEGCLLNIPSIGFSSLDDDPNSDLSCTEDTIKYIIERVLINGIPYRTCLNVNFPANYNADKGFKVCRMGQAYWKEEFEQRIDTHNQPYYWLRGSFIPIENDQETDIWIIKNGYASVVPMTPDLTAYEHIKSYNNIFAI